MSRIAIVGGGLAGLTAALRLSEHASVHLFEAAPRLGGQLLTVHDGGVLIERGAEGFVARSTAVPALAQAAGLPEDEVIGQSTLRSYGFDGITLRALEPGEAATLLGFQVPQEELGRGIRTMRHGMGRLIAALARKLDGRVSITRATPVTSLVPGDAKVTVHVEGARLEVDAVIVATSAAAAAPLLGPIVGSVGDAMANAPTMSSVTVELAFPRSQIAHPLDGTGFVVALGAQQDGVRACAFTSSKFEGRAPRDMASVRVFVRPSDDDDLAALDDRAWIARALGQLTRVIPISGDPVHTCVTRWPRALPVYDDAHRAAVAALESALSPHPILLAGSAFHGAGIDAAVRSGERAAEALLARAR